MVTVSSTADKVAAAAIIIALIALPLSAYAITSLHKSLQETNNQIQALRSELEKLNSNQTSQLTSVENQVKALETTSQQLARQLRMINEEIAASKANQTRLSSQLFSLAKNLSTLQAVLTSLQQQVTSLNATQAKQLEQLQEQVASLEARIKKLEEEYANRMFPAVVRDATGGTVVIEERPTRIVALAPSVTEILYYVNATDRLVGVTQYTDWPPSVVERVKNGEIQVVGGFWNPSLEKILALNPDLVIGVANVPSQAQIKQELAAYGIPMILLPQNSILAIRDAILMVGEATGNIAEAARAASQYMAHIMSIKLAGEGVSEKARVALIVWLNPLYVAGNNTFQGSGIEWIGAENAFANVTGWAAVSPEALLEAKPTVIITTNIPPKNLTDYLNQTLGENATQQIPAVKDHRIYCIQGNLTDLINRPSPRFAMGLLLLQYLVYPQLYNATIQGDQCLQTMPNITWPTP